MSRRVRVPAEAEPRHPDAASMALLEELSAKIRPDVPELEDWCRTYLTRHRERLAFDLQLVTRFAPSDGSVLEYGAIPLLMTAALDRSGFAVAALDGGPERFASAIRTLGLTVHPCDVETEATPFPDDHFDLVLFNELFEHLRIDPIFTLKEVLRVLRPGGRLLLSTPNLRSFRGLRNLVLHDEGHAVSAGVYRQYEKLGTLGHMGHVREYTTFEVADFLTRVGFQVETLIHRGGHGRGLVGMAERFWPAMRPFFTLVARKGLPNAERPA